MMRWSWLVVLALGCVGGSDKDDDTDDGGLTEEAFSELLAEAGCDAQIACNADPSFIDAFCEPDETTNATRTDCTFNTDYAADCLEGEWTCTSVAGYAYAEPPSVCYLVTECTGTTGDDDDDTTGDDDDDDDVAPMEFDDASLNGGVDCAGSTADFSFEFLGQAIDGRIDMSDTANGYSKYGSWNETHTLVAFDLGEFDTALEALGIQTGASLSDWADGSQTVFRCEYHIGVPGVMSYAARAYDEYGALADCVAWGENPSGFIDGGVYITYNGRPDESEFSACRVATAAR